MTTDVRAYNDAQIPEYKDICDLLAKSINTELADAENKIWHKHPVWFLQGNPIVGYSIQKKGVRLMFWSGADFADEELNVKGEKFKDASVFFNSIAEVRTDKLRKWLRQSRELQWDYKNVMKRKGKLERITPP